MPTEMAATCVRSGSVASAPPRCSQSIAIASATQLPVMAAVRVPPSAWITSQSTVMVCSPSASRSMTARSERPIRRWISCERPLWRPCRASRSVRVWVERGSMPYSAVTQPWPVPRSQRGTPTSTLAAHSTCVSPAVISAEPSAWRIVPASISTGRS